MTDSQLERTTPWLLVQMVTSASCSLGPFCSPEPRVDSLTSIRLMPVCRYLLGERQPGLRAPACAAPAHLSVACETLSSCGRTLGSGSGCQVSTGLAAAASARDAYHVLLERLGQQAIPAGHAA